MPQLNFAAWMPDSSDLNGQHTQSVLNVIPTSSGYGPVKSVDPISVAVPGGEARGAFFAKKSDGSVLIFVGTADRIYILDNVSFTWTEVSKGGAAYGSLSSTANWTFAQFNNVVIACQANSVPQAFNVATDAVFSDLGGSPPQAAYIAIVNRFVVLSGLTSFPRRVQWSGLNAITTWTSGLVYSDSQDLPDGGETRGVVGGELGIIIQDSAVRRMTFSPGSDFVFDIHRIAKDIGTDAPYSIIDANGQVFFLSGKGFVKMGTDGSITPIGIERVDRYFNGKYDAGASQCTVGSSDPTQNLIFWSYRETGRSGPANRLLAYHTALDRWAPIAMTAGSITSIARPGQSVDAIDTDVDTIEWSFDDLEAATSARLAMFDANGRLGFLNGPTLESTLETSEQSQINKRLFVRGVYPITDAPAIFASVGARESIQVKPAYSTESAVNRQGLCPHRVSTRLARSKIRIPAGTTWTFATGVTPDFGPEGSR